MVTVPAGSHEVGAGPDGFAYDNERPRHAVELDAFEIDRAPVSNAAFAEFVAATGADPPLYWEREARTGSPRSSAAAVRSTPAGPSST